MSFPTQLDTTALRQLARFVTGADRDQARLALAVYDLTGFALGRFFGDAQYVADMAQADPIEAMLESELATADSTRLKELLLKYGPLVLKFLLDYFTKQDPSLMQSDPHFVQLESELATANGERLRELIEKYGPIVARILIKLFLKV